MEFALPKWLRAYVEQHAKLRGSERLKNLTIEALEKRQMLTAAMPGDVRQDLLTVPLDGSVVNSTFVPQAGVTYHLRGSGTTGFIDTPNGRKADVEFYDYQNNGTAKDLSSPNLGSVDVGLKLVDGSGTLVSGFSWGAYKSDHAYVVDFVGTGQPLHVKYIDVPGFYSDNTGSFSFQIYEPVKVQQLKLTDGAFATNTSTANTSAATDLSIHQNSSNQAVIKIDGLLGPDVSSSKPIGLWKIDAHGNTASRSAGSFNDSVANRTATLTAGVSGEFDVLAGGDTNEDGVLQTSEITRTVHVHSLHPAATLSGSTSSAEGSAYTLNLGLSNVRSNSLMTWNVNWGDGTTSQLAGTASTATHYFADGPSSRGVSASVTDGVNTYSASGSPTVSVSNVAPTLTPTDGGDVSIEPGVPVTLSLASVSDPGFTSSIGGTTESISATVDWGDGSSLEAADLTFTPGTAGTPTIGRIKGTHNYASSGTRTIQVSVSDDDGGTATTSLTATVAGVEAYTVPGTPDQIAAVTLNLVKGRTQASFHNELALYVVGDDQGTVSALLPGQSGYANAAFTNSSRQIVFNPNDPDGTPHVFHFPGGTKLSFYLVQNSNSTTVLAQNPQNLISLAPRAFFPYAAANPDNHYAHFRRVDNVDGTVTYNIEDLSYGGDKDFDDMVVNIGAVVVNPPAAPTNFDATAISSTEIDLAWADNSNDEDGFYVERWNPTTSQWDTIATLDSDITSYDNTGLSASTTYLYRVAAFNAADEVVSNEDSDTTFASAPAAPNDLSATAISASEIALDWSDVPTAMAYNIYRSLSSNVAVGTGTFITQVATSDYQDQNLDPSTRYYYRITAENAVGPSGASNEANAITETLPLTVSATAGYTVVGLRWNDPSPNEQGFQIERKTPGNSFSVVQTTAANITEWVDKNLTPGVQYTYRVTPIGGTNDGLVSNEASAIPFAGNSSWYFNDFEGDVADWTEWTSAQQSITPIGSRKFLGEYDNGTQTITWPLPSHTGVTVEFDLFVLRTWDGLGPFGGEIWSLDVEGGQKLIETNFRNQSPDSSSTFGQSYPKWYPYQSGPWEGATEAGTLGYYAEDPYFSRDAVYHMKYTFPHTEDFIKLDFSAANLGGGLDETWGLDNVRIYDGSGVPSVPNAPTNVAVGQSDTNAVDVDWADSPEPDVTSYNIYASPLPNFEPDSSTRVGAVEATEGSQFFQRPVSFNISSDWYYKVTAVSPSGESQPSNEVRVSYGLSSPSAPTGLIGQAVSDSEIKLTWNDTSSNEVYFLVQKWTPDENGGGQWDDASGLLPMNTRTFTDSGLDPSTTYQYRVLAINGTNIPIASSSITATTKPTAPFLSYSVGSYGEVNLSWGGDPNPDTSYTVYRRYNGGQIGPIAEAISNLSYTDYFLEGAGTYTYTVVASVNGISSLTSNEATTTATTPNAPTTLNATPLSDTEISLSWIDNSTNEYLFELDRSADNGSSWETVRWLDADTTSYDDTELSPATTYQYRIRSVNFADGSAYVQSGLCTTTANGTIPSAPQLGARVASGDQIDLSWSDDPNDNFSYRIYRGTDPSFVPGDANFLAEVVGGDFVDTTLPQPGIYYYRIITNSVDGLSLVSAAVSADSLATPTTPVAPDQLNIISATPGASWLSWNDNSDNETGFVVERSDDSGATWYTVGTTAANEDSFADRTGATPNAVIQYRASATNATGTTQPSTPATAPVANLAVPPIEPGLTATFVSPTSVSLTWNGGLWATSYRIEQLNGDGKTWSVLATPAAPLQSYTVNGLALDTVYSWRVIAINSVGQASSESARAIQSSGTANGNAKKNAFDLMEQEEARHRGKIYYRGSKISEFFDQEAEVMNWVQSYKTDAALTGVGGVASATYGGRTVTIGTLSPKPMDVVHELVHALDDRFGYTAGVRDAESLAYSTEYILDALYSNLSTMQSGKAKTIAQFKQRWDFAWKNIDALVGTAKATAKQGIIKWTFTLENVDFTQAQNRLNLNISESSLALIYSDYLHNLGYNAQQATSLDPTPFTIHPCFD